MNQLHELSNSLLVVHKALIDFQKGIQENLDERKLSAHELLQNCINHPDYEWLRKISTLIALIDEKSDEPVETLEAFEKEAKQELQDIFIDESKHASFKTRLELALNKNPHLYLDLTMLKKQIGKLTS
jgi:hypothetical protein